MVTTTFCRILCFILKYFTYDAELLFFSIHFLIRCMIHMPQNSPSVHFCKLLKSLIKKYTVFYAESMATLKKSLGCFIAFLFDIYIYLPVGCRLISHDIRINSIKKPGILENHQQDNAVVIISKGVSDITAAERGLAVAQ